MTGVPYLSFVVPVYRVEPYLAKCLDSILADPSAGIEVIAVDDSSPDRCGAILDEYARRDPRLRVVRLPANVGLGQARNAGLGQATGEYVWFVDGDDWLPDGAVRAVIDRLAMTNPDVLIIDHAEVFDEDEPIRGESGDLLRGLTAPIRLADRPELLRLAQSACTKVARRAYLAGTGLRFRPGWYEDASFSHPLLMAAGSIDVLDAVGYCYRRHHEGGITKTLSSRHFEVFDQYAWLFEWVDNSAGAYDEFRPELFRLMINHYLVIVGNNKRLPADQQRAFFRRIFEDYRRWLPAAGYAVPAGAAGIRHRLAMRDAYWTYAVLRQGYRAMGGLRRKLRVGRRPIVLPVDLPVIPPTAVAPVIVAPVAAAGGDGPETIVTALTTAAGEMDLASAGELLPVGTDDHGLWADPTDDDSSAVGTLVRPVDVAEAHP